MCRYLEPYLHDESVRVIQQSKKMAGETFKVENNRLIISGLQDAQDIAYILCPYGVGDTLYALALTCAGKQVLFPGRRLCFIMKESHAVMCGWFDENAAVAADSILSEALNYFCVTNGITRLDNFLYAHFPKTSDFCLLPAYNDFPEKNMISRYKGLVFDLPSNTVPEVPQIPGLSEAEASSFGIDKRTIILMPYAKSCLNLLPVFWEALAKGLMAFGYKVFTNAAPGEEAVPGTQRLSEDLEKTAGLCEKALAVISLRSGICDVLAFTETILFVVNTSEYLLNEWNLSYATSREGIVNLLCDSHDKLSDTAKTLLNFFQEAMTGA